MSYRVDKMSHYRVRLENSPIVHASATRPDAWLYCHTITHADPSATYTDDLVTCPDCRAVLVDIWASVVDAQADRDALVEYRLADDGEAPSGARILARCEVEGERFVRFVRRWDNGSEQLCFYKLERFVNLLVDGNAYMQRQNRRDVWKWQNESSADSQPGDSSAT